MPSDLHAWWTDYPNERYWIEVTGRSDIGTNLKAPQTNETGDAYWSYSLLHHVEPGDVVFHYDRNEGQIIGASVASGELWEQDIVWAARGTYAREAGIEPHLRPGWYVGLEGLELLDEALTLGEIREEDEDLRKHLDALTERVGSPLYYPFERGESRPIRALQGYLFKLPAFFLDVFPRLQGAAVEQQVKVAPPITGSAPSVGGEYRVASKDTSVGAIDPQARDPALVERGLRGHAATQNALADLVRLQGYEPKSPVGDDPNFDLAWEADGTLWVAEVKSITPANEEKQLRLGLGQVLRFRHQLSLQSERKVEAVVAVESRPTDRSWEALCQRLDVSLTWPGAFDRLL